MHTVRFVHTGGAFEAENGRTLLSIADENGKSVQRGCNNGMCDICRLRIVRGVEHLLNAKTQRPFATSRVQSCIAEIHGDVDVER
ncbi:2Fe-2S iron-sulfur cluster binding domain-containing protein [Candidatus Peregrinibacteria bacterium]|nr:2Fe-2S iron-sulfur cluster binding domain-containing protein [Candidatus Peregrinibacteria bacterium]